MAAGALLITGSMIQSSDMSHRFPDFIIGGAPKCGTTSLHFILAQHADIGIPDEEIHYFDADDPITHPDFFFTSKERLEWFDYQSSESTNWYASRFAHLKDVRLIGEDSTTYLFSEVAAHRIFHMLPQAKIIFMIRNPVERAHSQYWHLMKTARTTDMFETALYKHPSIMLGSTYKRSIEHYFNIFGRERVLVLLFEEFVKDTQNAIDQATDFLGASRMTVEARRSWYNRTFYPATEKAQRRLNRFGGLIVRQRYRNHMGARRGPSEAMRRKIQYWWFEKINPRFFTEPRPPSMRPETRAYLARHLADRNRGLSELLGRDLSEAWTGFSA